MSNLDQRSASFEPERLTSRRRRVDPVIVIAGVVVVAIALAVLKPWAGNEREGTATGAAAAPSPVAAASAAPPGAAGLRPAAIPRAASVEPIAWPRAADAIRPHDAWGVRALVIDPGRPPSSEDRLVALAERWVADRRTEPLLLPTADQGVLALGVTFPPDELPLETRVYAATEDGGWTWLDVRPLPGAPGAVGALLFAPPIRDGEALATWPTGAYRIQALLGPRVHTMEVHLPDRFEVVPSPPPETRPSAASPFAPVFQLDETDRAFVVEDGVARPLIGTPSSDPLDLARAWLDAETTADGAVLDQVPSIHAPRAAGLGVMLPVGSRAHSGTITSLAPTTGDLGSRRALGVRFWDAGRSPYVIFRAPRGSTWPAGLYRMDVQWTDDDGSHRAAYHVELRPGPEASVPPALSAARVLAAAAGVDGVVAYAPGARRPRPSDCGGSPGREPPTALGVTFDPHRSPEDIGVEMRLDGGRRQEQPVLKARDVVPGLTLLVPPTGGGFTPGVYALTLATGTTLEVRLACAAMTPPG